MTSEEIPNIKFQISNFLQAREAKNQILTNIVFLIFFGVDYIQSTKPENTMTFEELVRETKKKLKRTLFVTIRNSTQSFHVKKMKGILLFFPLGESPGQETRPIRWTSLRSNDRCELLATEFFLINHFKETHPMTQNGWEILEE